MAAQEVNALTQPLAVGYIRATGILALMLPELRAECAALNVC